MQPPFLKKGDKIALVSPAKAIDAERIHSAEALFREAGFEVEVFPHAAAQDLYFAGTIMERSEDVQRAMDDPSIRAVVCCRGGYGSLHVLDNVDLEGFLLAPKWLTGFSDITVFHSALQALDCGSIHGTMPLDFEKNTPESKATLIQALLGERLEYRFENEEGQNLTGEAQGILVGGNLSVFCGLLGTRYLPAPKGKLLFLEEVGEPLYKVDRMFMQLKLSGWLKRISGVVIGGMTDIKHQEAFHADTANLIREHLEPYAIPVAFGAPAGHLEDNRALRLGSRAYLTVRPESSTLVME